MTAMTDLNKSKRTEKEDERSQDKMTRSRKRA
jgi:hypothetical protein